MRLAPLALLALACAGVAFAGDFTMPGERGQKASRISPTGVISRAITYGGVTLSNSVTGTGSMVLATSPALTTPDLGTPTALVGTNISGTAASLTAGHVTTNANLTGPITSSGNTTSITAQTGTGTTFAMDTSPVLVTPSLGVTTVTGTGAASTSGMIFTGAPFAGNGTTSFPLVFIQPSAATASTTWGTSGTLFGINAHTGISNFLDFQLDGTSAFKVSQGGTTTSSFYIAASAGTFTFNARGILSSPAAAKIQLGTTDAATATAQSLKVQNVVAGTTDVAGANWNIEGSQGTGTGTGGSILLRTAPAGTTASTQNAEQTVMTLDQKSHVGLASAAIPTIGSCGTGSPAVTAGSTDISGEFTTGTSATACTLTFKQTFASQPFCVAVDKTTTARLLSYTLSTTTIVATMTSNSGDVVEYHCFGT